MTLILHDHAESIRVSSVPVDVALRLAGQLPLAIRLRVQADPVEPRRWRPETRAEAEARPAGWFGLAAALAYGTWDENHEAEYAEYLRDWPRHDPRD